ncbi:MAG: peptidylprolyl isomerase [Deltaproteobacteria bacterium]|nr:peptidylprolyl isomerase [Deltaproteobacteria bacterium]
MRKQVLSLFGIAALATACPGGPGSPPADQVAKVNSTVITKADFDAEVDRTLSRFKGPTGQVPPQLESRIKDSTLKRMIDDAVIRDKAKSLGVALTPQEMEAKFTEHKSRFGSDQEFRDFLTRSKSTEEQVKASLEMQMLRERVLEKMAAAPAVTDEEVTTYFNEHKDNFKEQEQVKARHILARVEVPPPTAGTPNADQNKKALDEAKKKAKKKIEDAQKKLKGGAKFEDVAKEMSDDVTKNNGGDLGLFSKGRMVPPFEEAAFKMKPGETSGIVETSFGYHIIKVEEHKAARERPLEEVKESIRASLLARKRSDLRRDVLKKIKDEAKVEEFVKFEVPPPPAKMPGQPGAPPVPIQVPPGGSGAKIVMPPPGGAPTPTPTPAAPAPAPTAAPAPAPAPAQPKP